MNDLDKLRADAKAAIAELKGKSDTAIFTIRRLITALERSEDQKTELIANLKFQEDFVKFLQERIVQLESSINKNNP